MKSDSIALDIDGSRLILRGPSFLPFPAQGSQSTGWLLPLSLDSLALITKAYPDAELSSAVLEFMWAPARLSPIGAYRIVEMPLYPHRDIYWDAARQTIPSLKRTRNLLTQIEHLNYLRYIVAHAKVQSVHNWWSWMGMGSRRRLSGKGTRLITSFSPLLPRYRLHLAAAAFSYAVWPECPPQPIMRGRHPIYVLDPPWESSPEMGRFFIVRGTIEEDILRTEGEGQEKAGRIVEKYRKELFRS